VRFGLTLLTSPFAATVLSNYYPKTLQFATQTVKSLLSKTDLGFFCIVILFQAVSIFVLQMNSICDFRYSMYLSFDIRLSLSEAISDPIN
jgi:hypothetical protein